MSDSDRIDVSIEHKRAELALQETEPVDIRMVLGGVVSAVVGLALYAVLTAVVRPRGLRDSWAYLRALR